MVDITRYIEMQKNFYEGAASRSRYGQEIKADSVVGTYHAHNDWADYDRFLMRYIDESYKSKLALDFGCGPGRNIVRYSHLFARMDGCDIANKNIENAKENLEFHGLSGSIFYLTNGNDLGDAPSNCYDFIMSTICMQHICVHAIRFSIFQHMFRALRKGGRISIQMGFGSPSPSTVGYYDNFVDAQTTNRGCDTCIDNSDQLERDLHSIGFLNFDYWVRPVGPGDSHPYWIFFTATK